MSLKNRNRRTINKAKKAVVAKTADQLAFKAVDVLDEMRAEKWRYRAMMAFWLVLPCFRKKELE